MVATAKKMGSVPSTLMAEILAQSVAWAPMKPITCTVKVVTSLRVRTSANR